MGICDHDLPPKVVVLHAVLIQVLEHIRSKGRSVTEDKSFSRRDGGRPSKPGRRYTER